MATPPPDYGDDAAWEAAIAERYRRATEISFAWGQMNYWLQQMRRHRAQRGKDMALANAIGWASR